MDIDKKILEEKADVLKAISHPVRLCIVRRLLKEGEKNVTEMQNCLEAPQSTVSQHLSRLKAAGIIEGRREGIEIYYKLINKDVEKILKSIF
ncbi:winged helix-turn-helix transcriptional regulator [Anaerosalibacter bizertensis]|uniref:Metalloregulator ArsR/SmtB family transcription factor n=1 Tax=Anaerosalibacter bizertensis TaxID=932217 RepID=A0A844FE89_9FIRM|nr:metalloregulator ArsR/SmtB family transcription factor [Anaerosalibacter bizertensis]MBV1817119.1 metalloregulator ArsR/SmtB family transcription factor [Bacteroidales bacterium MSK.15.36]HHV27850.1 winged helix-turn-helix transcriptional regulator [Tissierellia bacterium]MCB5558905.1 metalloregulator ArsR/SmtB family transcription factor [Anaerosalibacter bizertensis]MCG4564850.1 metalloregulator ArsR/SmtB family transcription factor [Anaerosalibacter bizertensis]MCG4581614.1 metalloregula